MDYYRIMELYSKILMNVIFGHSNFIYKKNSFIIIINIQNYKKFTSLC